MNAQTTGRFAWKSHIGFIVTVVGLAALPFVLAVAEGLPVGSLLANDSSTAKFLQGLLVEVFILAVFAISYDLVLGVTGLPLMVFGPGIADLDNELLVAVAEETAGERLVLGVCEDKNYRTIVAAAMAHGHLVDSRTPMDVNLAKQLIILTRDVGLPMDRILMDPSTGALGYGIEYGYSVMERLRLAALNGDSMTQQPMLVTPGEEGWKLKESKVGEGVPASWGNWNERAVTWEVLTSSTLLQSGADIVVLRHPDSITEIKSVIQRLMAPAHNGHS